MCLISYVYVFILSFIQVVFSSPNCLRPMILLNPIVDVIPVIPFFISICVASCCKFSMIFLILS